MRASRCAVCVCVCVCVVVVRMRQPRLEEKDF